MGFALVVENSWQMYHQAVVLEAGKRQERFGPQCQVHVLVGFALAVENSWQMYHQAVVLEAGKRQERFGPQCQVHVLVGFELVVSWKNLPIWIE